MSFGRPLGAVDATLLVLFGAGGAEVLIRSYRAGVGGGGGWMCRLSNRHARTSRFGAPGVGRADASGGGKVGIVDSRTRHDRFVVSSKVSLLNASVGALARVAFSNDSSL